MNQTKPKYKVKKTPENKYQIVYTGYDGNKHYLLYIKKYCFIWETRWKFWAKLKLRKLNKIATISCDSKYHFS